MAETAFKVHFFPTPEPLELTITPNTTIKDLKKQLARRTCLDQNSQKLVKNNVVITEPDDTTILNLKLQENDKILLLTKEPKTVQSFLQETNHRLWEEKKSNNLKKHYRPELTAKPTGPPTEEQLKLLKSCFTLDHLNSIAAQLFSKATWKGREKQLIEQQGFLQFVLQKLIGKRKGIPAELFRQLEGRIYRFIIMNYSNEPESDHHPKPTYDPIMFEQISKMQYPPDKIIEALHRTSNNYYEALNLLYTSIPEFSKPAPYALKDSKQFQIPACPQNNEEMFIYRWLTKQENKALKLRLSLEPKQLQIYINSLKFRCPPLYDIFRKHHQFALKVLERQNPEKKDSKKGKK